MRNSIKELDASLDELYKSWEEFTLAKHILKFEDYANLYYMKQHNEILENKRE